MAIYGHEHRTETTMGDEVSTVGKSLVDGVIYINLPSSGCVLGKKTTYVTMSLKDGMLETEVIAIDYDRERLLESLDETDNPNKHFFGGNYRD